MPDLTLSLILGAFVAGLVTFLAPCTLPLIPGYLSFISGTEKETKRITRSGLFFMLGFSTVFILFGVLAGIIGASLVPIRSFLTTVGGIVIVLLGLFMIGAFKSSLLSRQKNLRLPASMSSGTRTSSFVVGATFALGWTPCVGPVLATVLLFATLSHTLVQSVLLLAVFSIGLALPFLALAFGYEKAQSRIQAYFALLKKYRIIIFGLGGVVIGFLVWLALLSFFEGTLGSPVVATLLSMQIPIIIITALGLGFWSYKRPHVDPIQILGGLFLIPLGIILFNNSFGLITQYGFEVFKILNYEQILDLL